MISYIGGSSGARRTAYKLEIGQKVLYRDNGHKEAVVMGWSGVKGRVYSMLGTRRSGGGAARLAYKVNAETLAQKGFSAEDLESIPVTNYCAAVTNRLGGRAIGYCHRKVEAGQQFCENHSNSCPRNLSGTDICPCPDCQ